MLLGDGIRRRAVGCQPDQSKAREWRLMAYFVEKLGVASVRALDLLKSDGVCRLIADLDLHSLCIWLDLDHPEALGLSCGGPQQVH